MLSFVSDASILRGFGGANIARRRTGRNGGTNATAPNNAKMRQANVGTGAKRDDQNSHPPRRRTGNAGDGRGRIERGAVNRHSGTAAREGSRDKAPGLAIAHG